MTFRPEVFETSASAYSATRAGRRRADARSVRIIASGLAGRRIRARASGAPEAGASLRRTQHAMGHSDPRTTERYDRARDNLADNAADYVARVLG